MKLSSQSYSLIESAIKSAMNKFVKGQSIQTIVSDIHLQPIQSTGELIIFDDEDNELSKLTIDEWIEYNESNFYDALERIFRSILSKEKDKGYFDNLSILTPYSFVLVDEEKETIAELLLIDDDTILVNDELLKDLDKELDDFLKELLKI